MDSASGSAESPRHGKPARVARAFGWSVLTVLVAFLINDVLVVHFHLPGLRQLGAAPGAWASLALFALAVGGALALVAMSPNRALRWDAHLIHSFNVYLVLAQCWSVFFVGIADISIAFLRVQDMAVPLFGHTLSGHFGSSNWVRTLEGIPAWGTAFREALYKEMGNPETDGDDVRRISPLFHATKIARPLRVLQGANDPRVLKVESDEIVEAAKKNGVPVEYVVFDDEGHGFLKKENQIEGYKAILAFLEEHVRAAAGLPGT